MIDRLLENWLDNSTERSWQKPFCSMLMAQGHSVVHSTRHSEFELGVDVISIDQNGDVCAFQLKSTKNERLTLREWRAISNQIDEMVCRQLSHPAIPANSKHQSFLVVDAMLEESVAKAIDDRNHQWINLGNPDRKIQVILRKDLMSWASELGEALWPSELRDSKRLLEVFLSDGAGQLPVETLWKLLESTCPIKDDSKKPSIDGALRAVSSAILLTGIAISEFTKSENSCVEIEAWTICLAVVCATCDRWNFPMSKFKNSIQLIEDAIHSLLLDVKNELEQRKQLLSGDALYDAPFGILDVRRTQLCGLMSILALKQMCSSNKVDQCYQDRSFASEFVCNNYRDMKIWGEAAIPSFIATFFLLERVDATTATDQFLIHILSALVECQKQASTETIPTAYYSAEQALNFKWIGVNALDNPDSFRGRSYVVDAFVDLVARRGWKAPLQELWKDLTTINRCEFILERKWDFYRWRNPNHGTNATRVPKHRETWDNLLAASQEQAGRSVPRLLKQDPLRLLLFLQFMPFRMNASAVRWLDEQMRLLAVGCRIR